MTTSLHERMLSALGAAMVLALLGYALVVGLTVAIPHARTETIALLSLQAPPVSVAPIKPPPARSRRIPAKQRPRVATNKASSAAPLPRLQIPPASPALAFVVRTASTVAPSSGDNGRAGLANGSGEGDGTDGDGAGGRGGDGAGEMPPRLIRGRLRFSDLPAAMRERGAGGTVSVRYDVEIDGKVSACTPIISSGDTELDQRTCQLIRQRFRFDPSRDGQGRPVRSTIEEAHSWEIDRTAEEDRPASSPPSR